MTENEFCKQHARIDEAICKSEEMFKEIFMEMKTKASNATLKWGVGILITILLAVISFSWANIRFQENRIESGHKEIMEKLETLKNLKTERP